jgi:hypothetical protein
MSDTAPVSGAAQVTVWSDGTDWSVTWWYPDGRTITQIGDVTVVDLGDGGAHICRTDSDTRRSPGDRGTGVA